MCVKWGALVAAVGWRYSDLFLRHPLRPLKSDADLDAAIAIVDELTDRDDLTLEESDYREVLGMLVEAYEAEHHPMEPVSGVEMLRYLITDARGETQQQVAERAGIAASTLSAILSGKREMTRRHMEALGRYFHVKPSVFLGD